MRDIALNTRVRIVAGAFTGREGPLLAADWRKGEVEVGLGEGTRAGLLVEEVKVIPVVGLPATVGIGGDRYAAEVTKVSRSEHQVTVRHTTDGREHTFTKNKHGRYVQGRRSGYTLSLGAAETYFDPSF